MLPIQLLYPKKNPRRITPPMKTAMIRASVLRGSSATSHARQTTSKIPKYTK